MRKEKYQSGKRLKEKRKNRKNDGYETAGGSSHGNAQNEMLDMNTLLKKKREREEN